MKSILWLCFLIFPNFCSLEEVSGQLSTKFVFPKDRKKIVTGRIIGGEEVTRHAYPFQAGLYLGFPDGDTYFCGGTLITPSWVLTAAHCVFDIEKGRVSSISVVLGAHEVSAVESSQVVLETTNFFFHENYDSARLQNDIALVELPINVTLSSYINTVAIASGSKTYENQIGTILGWGKTTDDSDISAVLRKVETTILSNSECAATDEDYQAVIHSGHMCVSGSGIVGSCEGDSGGPLLVDGVQVGVVSFGVDSCIIGKPSVFTRVTAYHDWILEHTDGGVCKKNVHYSMAVLLVFLLVRWI